MRFLARTLAFIAVVALSAQPVAAQDAGILRDAETEHLLKDLINPLVMASGMPKDAVDVVIVNDPYECGTHLMDVKLVAPFFWEGRLELFLANTGHWSDVGGAVPGGFSARATEVYQEGIRITPLRL